MDGGEQTQTGRRSGQRADSNEKSKTTERHEGCARALEHNKKQAGESNDPRRALHINPWASVDWRVLFEQGSSPSAVLTLFDQIWARFSSQTSPRDLHEEYQNAMAQIQMIAPACPDAVRFRKASGSSCSRQRLRRRKSSGPVHSERLRIAAVLVGLGWLEGRGRMQQRRHARSAMLPFP
jgi:hypothetical protein